MARSIDLGNPFLADLDGLCEVLLVRHGEQRFDPELPLAAGVDAPLSPLGLRQAQAVGDRLAESAIEAVYSSDLQRARDTGQAIAEPHDLVVEERSEIQEIHLYRDLPQDKSLRQSLGADNLRAIYREANRTKRWDAYPHAEPADEFRARVVTTIDGFIADHHGDRIVVACHGGVINTYLAHLFGADHDQVCTIHHTSITTVRGADRRRAVVQVNDFAHVLPLQTELNPLNAS